MKIKEFDYELPVELIAQAPAEPRDSSRLLILDRASGQIEHKKFREIIDELKEGDLLVLNNSKVFKARLQAYHERSGRELEVFLVRPLDDYRWQVMIKKAKQVKLGDVFDFGGWQAKVLSKNPAGTARLKMTIDSEGVIAYAERHGEVPLPPYIKPTQDFSEQYQTVYAEPVGSVAAPTAGLHFTLELLEQIKARGVQLEYITLHVGLGTFAPVRVDDLDEHQMHAEFVSIDAATAERINAAKQAGRRVIAVGTTTVRALEGASLSDDGFLGEVNLFIKPGFEFKIVDAMVTNFHLPKSTLLVLVSAFTGKDQILKAYQEAIKEKYRFFSFGDAMMIE